MTPFTSLMRRADTLRRLDSDPVRSAWWAGYMRGLRRAHHGQSFGTDAEHALFVSAENSEDATRAALGRGYLAGLRMEPADPA